MSSDSTGVGSPEPAGSVAAWTRRHDEYTGAERAWHSSELRWGQFGVPEDELRFLGDVAGMDVVRHGRSSRQLNSVHTLAG